MGDAINGVVNGVAVGVNHVIAALAPFGIGLTLILIVLALLSLGASYMSGATGFVAPLIRFLGISTGVLWALREWTWLVGLSRATAYQALNAVGVQGYGAMFELAWTSAQRILTELVGISPTAPISSSIDSLMAALCAMVVLIGLSFPGMVAAVAEIELLLGSALAPLLLPMLAVGFLRPIGFGVIQWQVAAVLRIVALGLISHLIAAEVTRITALPSMDEAYQFAAVQQLTLLAILSVMVALAAGAIANSIARGTPGVMGSHSLINVATGAVNAAIGAGRATDASVAASRATLAALSAALGGGGGSGGQAGRAGSSGQGGGKVGKLDSGSAFP